MCIQGDVIGNSEIIEIMVSLYKRLLKLDILIDLELVLFWHKWVDPSHKSIKENQNHNRIDVKHTRWYNHYDSYIIT